VIGRNTTKKNKATREAGMKASSVGILASVAFVMLLLVPLVAAADPVSDFYRGKQMQLIVSTGPGGGYDAYARVLARYYGKHIPGGPTMVVQNMPGAGGIRATNHLYANAPKDGTVLALVHSAMTTANVLPLNQVQFDTSRINWIGNMEEEVALCVSREDSVVKTAADLLAKPFVVGGTGIGSELEIYPRVIDAVFGAQIKIVSGYQGGAEVALAMERGELDGRCGWPLSSIRTTRPDWLKDKKIHLLLQTGLAKNPELPDVPLITDFVHNDDDLALLKLVFVSRSLLRPVLAPPEVPPERVAALRTAFLDTLKDPAFLGEAGPQGVTITPMPGETVQKIIAAINGTPKPVVERAIKAMGTCDTCTGE
jgi:tripartite-type tricarboxylate transporter receptor subunit TctC